MEKVHLFRNDQKLWKSYYDEILFLIKSSLGSKYDLLLFLSLILKIWFDLWHGGHIGKAPAFHA